MKLNPEALRVVSFETEAAQSQSQTWPTLVPDTNDPTAATFCEFCATDSACW